MSVNIVVLAAGQGTRMRSARPKVLHELAGQPMLEHVLRTAAKLNDSRRIVVYGHGGDQVLAQCSHLNAIWVEQVERLGTGHAVAQAVPHIRDDDRVVVLYGDVPMISLATLERLLDVSRSSGFGLLTVELDDPTGYGRIVRDGAGDVVVRITEQQDANDEERKIREVNTGVMVIEAHWLKEGLQRLDNNNAQGEYYLTDLVELAVAADRQVNTVMADSVYEVMGVNDRVQLAELERHYQLNQARRLMAEGVSLLDPARFDLRGALEVGQDVVIDVNCVFEGQVRLGNNVRIGANCHIANAEIEDDVTVRPNCVIEQARVGKASRIGPFARLRPETNLSEHVHVGNFVEIKKSEVASGSKINHLSYVGDCDIGEGVNIGAGTITCNYDGANKHRTIIGNDVFIGSDTQLVAPVKVGDGATIGAGTTVTKDISPQMLALSRVQQITIEHWQRPFSKKKKGKEEA